MGQPTPTSRDRERALLFFAHRQRGRQSTRVWQFQVHGIYRERDWLELVRSDFYTFSSKQGNFKEISLEYSQYLPVILRARKSIKNLEDHPIWYLEILDTLQD